MAAQKTKSSWSRVQVRVGRCSACTGCCFFVILLFAIWLAIIGILVSPREEPVVVVAADCAQADIGKNKIVAVQKATQKINISEK